MKGVVLSPPTLHGAWAGICWADFKKGFEKGADTKTYVSTKEVITLIQPQWRCSRSPSCSCWLYDDPEAFCRQRWSISARNKTQEMESQLLWKQVEKLACCVILWGNLHRLRHLLTLQEFCPLDLSPRPSPYLFVLQYTLLLPLFILHPHTLTSCAQVLNPLASSTACSVTLGHALSSDGLGDRVVLSRGLHASHHIDSTICLL